MAAAAPLASKYRSLFVIGRGGMGSVEAAVQIDDERVVALKRLLPDAARDKRRAEMFLREAKLAKLLDHPNVVRAYDYGEVDGELYLAMEYVEGQPLSRVLKTLAETGEKLSPSLVAYVLAEVCEGLHAAHELKDGSGAPLNLVHRDVSPQNVMLAYDGHVRLLDFGVAKIETENVTKTGEVKGKTAYMSPEQAMGEPLDRRSDLFGVGAILYECLALARMWGDGTDMEIIRKLALEEPPPLPEAAPDEMRALYTALVARDAKDRPPAARDVADVLFTLVPQGKEAAASELAAILDTHFGSHAEDQRKKLASSLRESGLPAEPVAAAGPAPVEAPKKRGRAIVIVVGLAAIGAGIYGYERLVYEGPVAVPPVVGPSPPSGFVSAEPVPRATPPTSTSTSSAPIEPPEERPAVAPPGSTAPPPKASAVARPVGVVPPARPKPSAVPSTTASAAPAAKPSSDVIKDPF